MKKKSNQVIDFNNNTLIRFDETTFINPSCVTMIIFREYAQISSNTYYCYYELALSSGKVVFSPKFSNKNELDNWLNSL